LVCSFELIISLIKYNDKDLVDVRKIGYYFMMTQLKSYLLIVFCITLTISFEASQASDCLSLIEENQCIDAINACSVEANNGDLNSQLLYGYLLSKTSNGDFRRNYKKSVQSIRSSAEQGYTKAQLAMAEMYMNGEALPMNAKKAKQWYEKAAEKGNLDGINGLARLYRYGTGVRKNYERSFELYEEAALQNHIRSQVGLGLSYRDAKGTKKNLVKAYAWLSIVSENISDSSFKKLQKDYEDERESIDKSKPQCKYIAKIDEFSEKMAIGYAKTALFDLKQRMSLKQIKKAKNLAIDIKKERVLTRSFD
jgi:TPR repeat protein